MGLFDEQIKERIKQDDELFADSFSQIAGAVLGRKLAAALRDESALAKDAVGEILRYYHIRSRDLPAGISDLNEILEFQMRPHGIMRRNVNLEKGWYKDAIGAMLGTRTDDGSVVALIPTSLGGYSFTDRKTGKEVRINRNNQKLIDQEAIAFYKPFPLRTMGVRDLIKYSMELVTAWDIILALFCSMAAALVGMLLPRINNILFGPVVENGEVRLLAAISVFLICVTVSSLLIGITRSLILGRINTKLDNAISAATMMRILSLPAGFFKDYSSGELSSYMLHVNSLCNMMINSLLSSGLTSVFSLVYISQIAAYAPGLVLPAIVVLFITFLVSVESAFIQMKVSRKTLKLEAKESGLTYALITGIQKIRLAGAEKRAFANWGKLYSEKTSLQYDPPVIIKVNTVINLAIELIGTIVMYYFAIRTNVSVADYYAFNSAYGMVSGAFLGMAGIALTVAQIKPVIEMIKPIMDAQPEISLEKPVVSKVSGAIELSNVSFRYNDDMPNVLDNLSLKIRPGQYVAIVGKTGCGKSTLMRLLMGFEKPDKGAIYYDGKSMDSIDLKSLRKHIGVVLQDGKLFQGDIFSNITISAPWLSLEEAWEAAETAGLAEDIRQMPMGMNTLISEGSGGISGGQKQRLMIARAIAPKPKILMFDEATSALDNKTQKKVSQALDNLKCTRIVIAHRLSTIRQCDRILVLDAGKIIEEGTYDQLIDRRGFFADLVERQRLDVSDAAAE